MSGPGASPGAAHAGNVVLLKGQGALMTNVQAVFIAAAILFAGGAIATAVGILAYATNSAYGDAGFVPGAIAMLAGAILGIHALLKMRNT